MALGAMGGVPAHHVGQGNEHGRLLRNGPAVGLFDFGPEYKLAFVRGLSAVFSVATIPVLYSLGKKLFNELVTGTDSCFQSLFIMASPSARCRNCSDILNSRSASFVRPIR
jgi:hypothetical protein